MEVLKPWTKVELLQGDGEFTVKVWGRQYTFKDSILPVSVISLGEELLAAPMELRMDFGKGEETPYGFRYEVFEENDDKIVITSASLCGNLIINAAVTVEYDGFMKLGIRFVPCGAHNLIRDWREKYTPEVKLAGARLVMKMKREASTLFHFWPNSVNGTLSTENISSGKFYDGKIPFKPTVWVGNERYGLNLCMETDENIQLTDPSECIVTRSCRDYSEITLNLLDRVPRQWKGREESWLDPLEPVNYELMFQATPVKKYSDELAEEWRIYRANIVGDDLKEVAARGVKWVMFHEEWSLIQNYCYPENKKVMAEKIREAHELGMKVILYFGYEYSSALPDFDKNMKQYLNKSALGRYSGGWTRSNIYQKAYIVCYNGGYSEEMLECARMAMDELGADGIYTDGTYIPWECANEAHGCGYRDENGGLHSTYPILAVREHVRKLYDLVHKRGGLVDAHQSACCVMPIMSFCDTYWDGENIQGTVSENLEKALNLDAFRAEYMGKNFGIVPQLIAYLKPPKYGVRNVLALSLIHDVIARPINSMEMLDVVAKVWDAYDDFGLKNSQWKPYWDKNSSVKSEDEGIYVSSWEKEDDVLAMVSKFGSETEKDVLRIPEKFHRAYEIFDGQEYEVKDGKIDCKLESATAYCFRFRQ